MGKLYIIGTPIGNLKDITLRAIETLKIVDILLVEDTRHTIKLLNHLEIKKKMISYHKFNEKEKLNYITKLLDEGNNIGLVSDAGMPTISDPGSYLVRHLIENSYDIEIIPGVTAITTAVTKSIYDTSTFIFQGFLNGSKKDKKEILESLKDTDKTVALYESPHKLVKTLKLINEVMGNRNVTIARELTKLNEEFIYTTSEDILKRLETETIKGEIVLLIEKDKTEKNIDERDNVTIVKELIEKGINKKEAIKEVAKMKKVSKNEVYKDCLDI